MASYNKNNAGVKRIMAEARELERDGSAEYTAKPTEEDLFDWHCTIRGPADTEFEGGLYHARIVLPPEYPFKAPSIMLLTPNGRFELNKKICISFTSYHEDLWQPSWGVRTAIIGLQSFFPVKGEAAMGVGGIEVPLNERKRLAALSRDWVCPHCKQSNVELLPDPPKADAKASGSSGTTEQSTDAAAASLVSKASEEASAPLEADTPFSEPIPAPVPVPTTEIPAVLVPSPPAVATTAPLAASTLPSSSPSSSTEPSIPIPAPSEISPIVESAPAPSPAPIRAPQSISLPAPISATSSRPIDLTPSTPAARIIDEVVPMGQGNHDDRGHSMMNNLGIHPAMYQEEEDDPESVGPWVEGQRAVPVWLDAAIGVLGAAVVGLIVKRVV